MYTVTSLFICFEILQIGKNTDLKRMWNNNLRLIPLLLGATGKTGIITLPL
jgi:hypothetical protein